MAWFYQDFSLKSAYENHDLLFSSLSILCQIKSILQPSAEENIMMDLLKVYLSLISDEYQIAVKHIVATGSGLSLVRLKAESFEAFKESGLVSSQLGDEGTLKIYRFLKGELGLKINDRKVELG